MAHAARAKDGCAGVHAAVRVLLVDDQPIVAEAVRGMLKGEADIEFHFCENPLEAIALANRVMPTVILQDLVMPKVDGLMLVKFFRRNPSTADTPLIVLSSKEEPLVKAEAFALGANDYLVKLPDRVEMLARIRYHSRAYNSLLERNQAYAALAASQSKLSNEIAAAEKYLRSLLPEPAAAPVRCDWRYIPCADLGGDTFGYYWLDADHLVRFMIDATGHGLDSALFSITAMNVLRSQSLPNTDFREPGQVLFALNEAFPMEKYGNKNFSIWYGVYHAPTRRLRWAGGGHPDALLFVGPVPCAAKPLRLPSTGPIIGMMPWDSFETLDETLEPGSTLFAFSDGVFEVLDPDSGTDWKFDEFIDFMATPGDPNVSSLDRLFDHVRRMRQADRLDDDFSIFELTF